MGVSFVNMKSNLCSNYVKSLHSIAILVIVNMNLTFENALRCVFGDRNYDQSTLAHTIAWCHMEANEVIS